MQDIRIHENRGQIDFLDLVPIVSTFKAICEIWSKCCSSNRSSESPEMRRRGVESIPMKSNWILLIAFIPGLNLLLIIPYLWQKCSPSPRMRVPEERQRTEGLLQEVSSAQDFIKEPPSDMGNRC